MLKNGDFTALAQWVSAGAARTPAVRPLAQGCWHVEVANLGLSPTLAAGKTFPVPLQVCEMLFLGIPSVSVLAEPCGSSWERLPQPSTSSSPRCFVFVSSLGCCGEFIGRMETVSPGSCLSGLPVLFQTPEATVCFCSLSLFLCLLGSVPQEPCTWPLSARAVH